MVLYRYDLVSKRGRLYLDGSLEIVVPTSAIQHIRYVEDEAIANLRAIGKHGRDETVVAVASVEVVVRDDLLSRQRGGRRNELVVAVSAMQIIRHVGGKVFTVRHLNCFQAVASIAAGHLIDPDRRARFGVGAAKWAQHVIARATIERIGGEIGEIGLQDRGGVQHVVAAAARKRVCYRRVLRQKSGLAEDRDVVVAGASVDRVGHHMIARNGKYI